MKKRKLTVKLEITWIYDLIKNVGTFYAQYKGHFVVTGLYQVFM